VLRLLQPLQSGFVRVIGSLLQLGLSLVLAHLSGTALLGRFLFFVAIVNLGTAIGGGMPNLMLRYASSDSTGSPPQVGWLWRHSIELSLLCAGVAAVSATAGDRLIRDVALAVGGLLVQRMSSAALKANGHPNLGVLLDTALYPLVVVAVALMVDAWAGVLSFETLRLTYISAVWGAAIVAVLLTWRSRNSLRSAWSVPWRTDRAMYAEMAVVTLGAVANIATANAALALAPIFLSDSATGILGLALRVAGFASTILVSLSAYFGPAFARAGNRQELALLRRRSQYACLALYVPVPTFILLLPANWLESVSSGVSSVKGLVLVLSVGYFVNAATGLAPTLLLMRGWSRVFSVTSVVTAVLTVAALVAGGKLAGAMGMAAGSSAVMAATSIWIFAVSTRRMKTMMTDPAIHRVTT
jgi:O-antigen/teichoic acid export membrane protein